MNLLQLFQFCFCQKSAKNDEKKLPIDYLNLIDMGILLAFPDVNTFCPGREQIITIAGD
jgi:hypothetical protein